MATYTQEGLDALVAAYLASTYSEVTYDGRTVKYRSMEELAAVIEAYAVLFGVDNPIARTYRTPPRHTYLSFRRA